MGDIFLLFFFWNLLLCGRFDSVQLNIFELINERPHHVDELIDIGTAVERC